MGLAKPPFPILQRGSPQAYNLGAAWPFYEGSGSTVHDLSGNGNGNDGTLNGGVTWTPGPNGWCLSKSNAGGDYISIPPIVLSAAGATAIALFSPSAFDGVLLGSSVNGNTYAIYLASATSINAQTDNASTYLTFAVPAMSLNQQYHVAMVRDAAGQTHIYLNGAESTSGGQAQAAVPMTINQIGRYAGGNQGSNYAGTISHVKIYSYALTPSQIAADYADSFAYGRPKRRVMKAAVAAGGLLLRRRREACLR